MDRVIGIQGWLYVLNPKNLSAALQKLKLVSVSMTCEVADDCFLKAFEQNNHCIIDFGECVQFRYWAMDDNNHLLASSLTFMKFASKLIKEVNHVCVLAHVENVHNVVDLKVNGDEPQITIRKVQREKAKFFGVFDVVFSNVLLVNRVYMVIYVIVRISKRIIVHTVAVMIADGWNDRDSRKDSIEIIDYFSCHISCCYTPVDSKVIMGNVVAEL